MAQEFRRRDKNVQILRMTGLVLLVALGQIACTGRPGSAMEAVQLQAQAQAKAQRGDYSGAVEAATRAIELWPQNPWLYARRGEYRYHLRDYAGAVTDLDQALQLNPRVGTAYEFRGRSRLALHDYAGAVADFDQGLQFYPDAAHLYFCRGVSRAHLEDFEGASADVSVQARPRMSLRRACPTSPGALQPRHDQDASSAAARPMGDGAGS